MVKKNDNITTTKKQKGPWVSWAELFGTAGDGGTWSKATLLKFLTEYRDNIIMAESSELLILLANAGLEYRIDSNEKFKAIILNEENSKERVNAIDTLISDYKSEINGDDSDNETDDENILAVLDDVNIEEANITDEIDVIEEEQIKLAPEAIIESFKLYDHEYIHLKNLDQEKVKFLIQNRINKMWNLFLNNKISINEIENECGGKYFTEIKNSFLSEYVVVSKIENPAGYCFKEEPMLMQKLVSHRLKVNKTYGNWSTVGAGKTLAGVYAGRYVGAKNTIVVTYNSTITGWEENLNSYFNDCNIFTKNFKNVIFEEGKNNYLILNYEFFQQGQKSENRLYEFMENNRIDYVILDEVHSVKQRKENDSMSNNELIEEGFLSSRRHLMMKFLNDIKIKNPDIYFMTMTATPIINNLVEAKKLLEMLQGQKFNELSTNCSSIKAALEFHKHVVFNGIRYEHTPKNKNGKEIVLEGGKPIEIDINGDDLLDRLNGETNDLGIEQIVLEHKLEAVRPYIRKNTMIFTYYVDGIVDRIQEYCQALGFRTGQYTGRQSAIDRDKVKKNFQSGKLDIIIGSLPIGTGVDGFQNACDRLICIGLPWTHSEYEQLVGRILREGSAFNEVSVIIPKVIVNYINNEGLAKSWSRDRHKLNIIKYKKDLFGIVVSGIIPAKIVTNLDLIKQKSFESLNDIIKKINSGEFTVGISREEIEKEFLEHSELDECRRKISAFGELNQKWNTRNSSTTFKEITKNAEEWHEYHRRYRAVRQNWTREETPFTIIGDKINKLNKEHLIVADFGCGDNLLKKEIKNEVKSFDMFAIDDTVTVADITNLPLKDGSIHIGVFSLSLMGRNHRDALKEAKRVIVSGGRLYVAEPLTRWENKEDGIEELRVEIEAEGFEVVNMYTTDKFVFIDAVNAL
jgi:superfamily II DNA or RNA helicase